ncbi:hypothetical protein N9E91_05390 [Alphaproteobacteria bacterium]|nr:hypothetical protein [Alphaproteobacteria bacterium]
MAQNRNKRIRDLRNRSKTKLVRVNDQLNALTWDILENNSDLNDVNARRAVAVLDDALSLIQRAGSLLNSVHIEADASQMVVPQQKAFVSPHEDKEKSKAKENLSRTVTSVN